jgi:hypothetical protein
LIYANIQLKNITMKNTIIVFLFAFITTAQAQTIVQDSSWLTQTSGIYFANRLQTYDNGNSVLSVTKVGDTTAVVQGAINVYRSQASTMASDAILLSGNGAKIREIIRQDGLLQTQVGKSALNQIALQVDTSTVTGKYFTASGWTIKDGAAAAQNIVFSFSAATGAFRYKIGSETVRLAYCLGNVIRLANYGTTGRALDFYRAPGGRWVTIDLQQQIIPPAAIQAALRN